MKSTKFNKIVLKSIPSRIVEALIKIKTKVEPIKKNYINPIDNRKLFFLFNGLVEYPHDFGRVLYKNNSIFRDSINEIDDIVIKKNTQSILSYYTENSASAYKYSHLSNSLILCATQIAIYEVLHDKGIHPDAILGLCQGEIPALYAAGSISKEDAVLATLSFNILFSNEQKEYNFLLVFSDSNKIKEVETHFINLVNIVMDIDKNTCAIIAHKSILNELCKYLTLNKLKYKVFYDKYVWPIHRQTLFGLKSQFYKHLEPIEPKPLNVDYYSTYCNKIPKGTLINKYHFFNYIDCKINLKSIFKDLELNKKHIDIVSVGPDFSWKKYLKTNLESKNLIVTCFSTVTSIKNSEELLKETISEIKGHKQLKENLNIKPSAYELFLNEFTTSSSFYKNDPYLYYSFMSKNDKIHYLPRQKEYFITDKELIHFVLGSPKLFSSSPYESFDKILLGADPPDHKKTRLLLMPLFKQSNLHSLETKIDEFSKALIKKLPKNKSFNFVNRFSIPLTKLIINEFLGLPVGVDFKPNKINGNNIYGVDYFLELRDFCEQCLENTRLSNARGAIKLLLELEKGLKLSRQESISLMRLLWVAGTTTTSSIISYSLYELIESNSLVESIKKDNSLINKFIDECLRIQSPESNIRRRVTEDTILDGVKLLKGTIVTLSIRAANTDLKYIDDPFTIKLDREFKKSIAFGSGAHYCLGMAFAKLETQVVMKNLIDCIDKISMSENYSPKYYSSDHFRSLEELMVTYNF